MRVVYKNSIEPRAEYRLNSPEAQSGCKAASLRRKEKAVLSDLGAAFCFSPTDKRAVFTTPDSKWTNTFNVLGHGQKSEAFFKSVQVSVIPSKLSRLCANPSPTTRNAQNYPYARDIRELSYVT
jgi:hypothetical protein